MGDFQNVFKKLRKARGYTQTQLAQKLQVGPSCISMYETGKREPDSAMLKRIADFFQVDINYLLGYAPSPAQGGYYLDPETARTAQEISENRELKALFDVTRDSTPENLRALQDMALILKRKERGDYGDEGC